MRAALVAGALALVLPFAAAQVQPAAPVVSDDKVPPAAAAAAPQPDDTNAQRAKTQPGNNAPFWRDVKNREGFTTLPGAENGVLIQPQIAYPGSTRTTAGEAWRQVRNQWIIPYGGALLVIALVAIALFYWRRGPMGETDEEHATHGSRRIERFTPFERATHWVNAITFVVLAVSGLVMAFGKFVLLPIMGGTLFGWLTYALKTAHNFAGPLFAVSTVLMIVVFVRDNIPRREDAMWLRKAGGMLSGEHVPSHRFNAGEKTVFWGGVVALGSVVIVSGLVLDKLIPGIEYPRATMQIAHMVHAVVAVLMMAMILGHIYLGTIGMRGAYRSMRTGYVTEGWAHEHHELWANDVRAGKIPAQRSEAPTPPLAKQL